MEPKAFYTPSDTARIHYDQALGNPGEFPYTRGIHPDMYRQRLWTMRQYAGYGTAAESNARFKHLLKQGQMGISVAFDLPTQMGYDPDDAKALGEVGRVGVNIASIEDMKRLFLDIPLEKVSTSMTINATASILLVLYIALGESQGIQQENLSGTLQNDVLKEYIARGTYIYPPSFSLRLAVDIIEYCVKFMPKMNPISISGYHMREAGATAAQEIAFTFANALAYLEESQKRGLSADDLGTKISFFFACHNNFFEEIAKFRAARRLWAHLMKNNFHARNPKACMLRFHTQTAGSTLTSRQPLNNVTRVSFQALAAVLGGTQSLHTNAYDEALALPTEESATLALRTQQILANETAVERTADPLGGSYYVESLTEALFETASDLLKEVEAQGGALECIRSGYFERAIQESAYEAQQQLETKQSLVVGVNTLVTETESLPHVMKVDPNIETEAVRRVRQLKGSPEKLGTGPFGTSPLGNRSARNQSEVNRLLKEIRTAAVAKDNLIPIFLEAVRVRVTLGEICAVLRDLFGEHDPGKSI